jgi:hypothetical protein
VAFAESFLSAKPSTSGKGPSPRGSLLLAKTPNPVVTQPRHCIASHIPDNVMNFVEVRNRVRLPEHVIGVACILLHNKLRLEIRVQVCRVIGGEVSVK